MSINRREVLKSTAALTIATPSVLLGKSAFASASPIKIGVIDDASGDFAAAVIPKTQGAQLAVAQINAAGGVLGRPLQLIAYDGQSDVRRHQEFAQRAILEDQVNVLMAGYTSSEREAARAVAVKNKTIFWHNNQGEGGIADSYSFFSGPIPEQQILPGTKYMVEKYGRKIYILAADYGFGQVSAEWVKASAALNGATIVGLEFIPLGNSEFASSIANIQKAKPDFLFLLLVGSNQSQYFPQALAANLKFPSISTVNLQQGYEHKRFAPPSLRKSVRSRGLHRGIGVRAAERQEVCRRVPRQVPRREICQPTGALFLCGGQLNGESVGLSGHNRHASGAQGAPIRPDL